MCLCFSTLLTIGLKKSLQFDHPHALNFALIVVLKLWFLTEAELEHKQNSKRCYTTMWVEIVMTAGLLGDLF